MSANNHKFPEPSEAYWHGPTDYNYGEVQDWFKRCMEEFPENTDSSFLCDSDGMIQWFDKWFSQFRTNSKA